MYALARISLAFVDSCFVSRTPNFPPEQVTSGLKIQGDSLFSFYFCHYFLKFGVQIPCHAMRTLVPCILSPDHSVSGRGGGSGGMVTNSKARACWMVAISWCQWGPLLSLLHLSHLLLVIVSLSRFLAPYPFLIHRESSYHSSPSLPPVRVVFFWSLWRGQKRFQSTL